MASRADNIASNLNLANFSKATDLQKRIIWFTIGALIVFRFMSFVPLPGVNPLNSRRLLYKQTQGGVLEHLQHLFGWVVAAHEPDRARRDAVYHVLDRGAVGGRFPQSRACRL